MERFDLFFPENVDPQSRDFVQLKQRKHNMSVCRLGGIDLCLLSLVRYMELFFKFANTLAVSYLLI